VYPDGGHASDNIKHPTPVNRWIISFPIKQPLLSILQPQKNGTCSSCPAPPASLLVVLPLLVPPPPRGGVTDSALYLQTFSHFVIVNKTCLPPQACCVLAPLPASALARVQLASAHYSGHQSTMPGIVPTRPAYLLPIHAHELARAAPRTSSPSTHTHEPVRPRRLGSGPRVALDGRILGENVPITRSWSARKRHARWRRVKKAYETHERTRTCIIARAHALLEKVFFLYDRQRSSACAHLENCQSSLLPPAAPRAARPRQRHAT
jgi:hypothetical protein